ncbi:hypothetical protein ACKWTF_006492 [Chironomus riparius]
MIVNVSDKRHRMSRINYFHLRNHHITLMSIVLISLIPLVLGNSICTHHEYWDSNLDECVPCTKCNRHQIVIRPCQRHLDTVCRPINSVDIDWSKSMLMATDRTTLKKEHHRVMSTMESFSAEAAESREEELLLWDWQLITLILAIIACLLFFIVTAIISINYVRQWRKIKKQFDTDIEHLSQQLMARLANPPSESATIFIDDPSSRNNCLGPRQIEVRCVYLEDLIAGKESLKLDPKGSVRVSNNQAGNVYIEDNEKRHVIVGHKLI